MDFEELKEIHTLSLIRFDIPVTKRSEINNKTFFKRMNECLTTPQHKTNSLSIGCLN